MSHSAVLIRFVPGINPEPDETKQNTRHCVAGNNVRFHNGSVETMGGHLREVSDIAMEGAKRAYRSFERDGNLWQIIGTNSKLYAKLGGTVTNITPLKTTSTALVNNPVTTATGTNTGTHTTLTIAHAAHTFVAGDRIKLSGSATVNGVLNTVINAEHIIVAVTAAVSYTITVLGTASSSSAGGGAAVLEFEEIAPGDGTAVAASGPGIGLPGYGLPGSIQTDTSLIVNPRIWWQDTFGDIWVGGPGDGGKCYKWLGDTDVAPTVITNAPNADWGWVEASRLQTLLGNVTKNSKTGDFTDWVVAAGSDAWSDTREDATKLYTQCNVNGENLVFAQENRAFRMRFIGGAVKWVWEKVSDSIGIVSPYGRVVVDGVAYIFGKDNFYYYNGGVIQPLPNCTLRKYVFNDINLEQRYKFFVWYNSKFQELHFHYASADSEENDRVAVFSIPEQHWTIRTGLERAAADQSGNVFTYPVLTSAYGDLYQHEVGYNDDDVAQDVRVSIAYAAIAGSTVRTEINGMEPDLILTGNMDIDLYGKERMRDEGTLLQHFDVSVSTDVLHCTRETRWRAWEFSQSELGGFFRLGGVTEFIKKGSEF